jgi:hypothetical protein
MSRSLEDSMKISHLVDAFSSAVAQQRINAPFQVEPGCGFAVSAFGRRFSSRAFLKT